MNIARIEVDFNEMLDDDLCLLSCEDEKLDSAGAVIHLAQGLRINVYMDDLDEDGNPDPLVASGTVELNTNEGWGSHVKWCIRIDENGIRHLSES